MNEVKTTATEKKSMDIVKIMRIKKVKKICRGYNSLWLVRCNDCGRVFLIWDTQMYVRKCPHCKSVYHEDTRSKEEIKDSIFRLNRRCFNEYKTRNLISSRENALLVELRERESLKVLTDLISDYWLKPSDSVIKRKRQNLVDARGTLLVNHETFIDLLEECYNLVLKR